MGQTTQFFLVIFFGKIGKRGVQIFGLWGRSCWADTPGYWSFEFWILDLVVKEFDDVIKFGSYLACMNAGCVIQVDTSGYE